MLLESIVFLFSILFCKITRLLVKPGFSKKDVTKCTYDMIFSKSKSSSLELDAGAGAAAGALSFRERGHAAIPATVPKVSIES